MMTTEENPPLIPISDFVASKQAGLFQTLKQPRFTGQLVLGDPNERQWTFYLYLGRIMYATGGEHPVRRWRRNLAAYLPQIASDISTLQKDLATIPTKKFSVCWEYELLSLWVDQGKITREEVTRMIRAVITEVFFDLTQAVKVTYQIKRDNNLSTQLVLIDADQVIVESWKLWQAWQSAKVADRSPNQAPRLKQPEQLQARTSPKTYQALSKLLNGENTLRDLSVQMKRDVVQVTRSFMPYIQLGFVELVDIPDLPVPLTPPTQNTSPSVEEIPGAVIACVDDSPMIRQTMEQIVKEAGYRFVGVSDALRAIAILLARKPDLIFLDLVMPNANGYEICSQLRKLSFFRHTPIVILTGNDGIIDRVRAKFVGSSDFMSKPVESEAVLRMISKHLKQESLS